jgi:hypothetical protein
MSAIAPPRAVLHVTNGDSTVAGLRRAGIEGRILPWRDVLNLGPVPAGLDEEGLREARAAFLAGEGWTTIEEVRRDLAMRDEMLDSAAAGSSVVLWFEADLYDQLQLVQVLDRLAGQGTYISLICIGSCPERPRFTGLGELLPGELSRLWPTRVPVTDDVVALATRAWVAVRSPDPTDVAQLVRAGTPGLPYLGEALWRLLEELPATVDGLSRTERHVLEAVADGAESAHEVFAAVQAREERPFHGDAGVFAILAGLARDGALDRTEPPGSADLPPGAARVALTAVGAGILAGALDRTTLGSFDRWVGGVHLLGASGWRLDREQRTVRCV